MGKDIRSMDFVVEVNGVKFTACVAIASVIGSDTLKIVVFPGFEADLSEVNRARGTVCHVPVEEYIPIAVTAVKTLARRYWGISEDNISSSYHRPSRSFYVEALVL